jgi:uncharacterized protein YukE
MDKSRQAAVDPEALRALASELSALASKILEMRGDLDRGLAVLGQTFQDEQYQQFRSAYVGSRQKLTAFTDEVRGLVPKLKQDADDIAAAQRVRLDR